MCSAGWGQHPGYKYPGLRANTRGCSVWTADQSPELTPRPDCASSARTPTLSLQGAPGAAPQHPFPQHPSPPCIRMGPYIPQQAGLLVSLVWHLSPAGQALPQPPPQDPSFCHSATHNSQDFILLQRHWHIHVYYCSIHNSQARRLAWMSIST